MSDDITDDELRAAITDTSRGRVGDIIEDAMWRWMNGDCEQFDALRERIQRLQEPDA